MQSAVCSLHPNAKPSSCDDAATAAIATGSALSRIQLAYESILRGSQSPAFVNGLVTVFALRSAFSLPSACSSTARTQSFNRLAFLLSLLSVFFFGKLYLYFGSDLLLVSVWFQFVSVFGFWCFFSLSFFGIAFPFNVSLD
ncbi:Hypothetical predicted protein [Drosophila guanche]|uniref:Uncharacterized protein n=1 Tax=Drosophila guanche TaxID=7266 RepID=A0A3B0JYJ8_DROGU|nr:Hypothetical predicted protein [Drosophila guanche]